MEFIFGIGIVILGLIVGSQRERAHFRSLDQRESQLAGKPIYNTKNIPEHMIVEQQALVAGNAAIAIDAFKKFMCKLIQLFGGQVTPYLSLVDRARREAILRMIESCPEADAFINLKIETVAIDGGGENETTCVEVLAYATAIKMKNPTSPTP